MANRIKGITVEIGGETKGLDKALKGVNDTSRDLQKELRDVQKLLKFDPNNAELLAQKQKLLNDQIENTGDKLKQLQKAEQQVQEQFRKGDIGEEQYRAFQRELQDTEQALRHTQNQLADLNEEQQKVETGTQQLNKMFELTESTLDDFSDTLGTRLTRAIQNGTATSRDLQRAFDMVGREALGASSDIKEIRGALQRVEKGETSITEVRRELQRLGDDANEAEGQVKELGSELANLAAGAAAGVGAAGIIQKAFDMSELDTIIELSMDIPDESKKSVKDAIKTVGSYIGDNEAALEGVRKQFQLNADLTDEDNQRIVKGAGTIASAYKQIDFTELIQETNEMALGMEMTHDEALGMTKSLLDAGFPPDQLDIISEYGQQLARAGYSAEEIQNIFAAGVETGTWNIDNLLDGLKEGRIKLAEFGAEVPKAIQDSIAGTEISAEQVKNWGKAIAEGGEDGKKAMMDVALALTEVEDETKRNELGVAFFGTMWEEQGSMITDTILGAKEGTADLAEGQRELNEDMQKLDASPTQRLNTAMNDLWTTLQPLLATVAEWIANIADWISKNPELAAGITAIVTVVGILIGVAMGLVPVVWALAGAATALNIGMLPLTAIILGIILVIGLLVAAGIYLYKNWDEIKAKAGELAAKIKEKFEEFKKAIGEKIEAAKDKIEEIWGNIMDFFANIDLKQTGRDILQGLIDGLWDMADNVWNAAKDIASGIGDKIANILQLGSPSKVMIGMGEDTGEGMLIGLKHMVSKVRDMSAKMAKAAIPEVPDPKAAANESGGTSKQMVVNIHSPKALDVREAKREFNRTLNKMSLMW